MTRDEVLEKLRETRAEFDRLVDLIPPERLATPVPGGTHSPKDIVYHVASYDDLMVRRLRSARDDEPTAFDRDRDSWEAFNDRIWAEAESVTADAALVRSSKVFLDLLEEVAKLTNEELSHDVGVTARIDQGWLQGRSLAETIGIDGFEHYPMHYAVLAAAAARGDGNRSD
jgi:hypothetical protein